MEGGKTEKCSRKISSGYIEIGDPKGRLRNKAERVNHSAQTTTPNKGERTTLVIKCRPHNEFSNAFPLSLILKPRQSLVLHRKKLRT